MNCRDDKEILYDWDDFDARTKCISCFTGKRDANRTFISFYRRTSNYCSIFTSRKYGVEEVEEEVGIRED